MRLLVTRPQPDADAQVETLKALGHGAIASPLLQVEFLDFSPLPISLAQALVVTSRNALRALANSDELKSTLKLPFYAVGGATAALARELGFDEIHQGPGTAGELPGFIEAGCNKTGGALIHLAGARQAFDLKKALEGIGFEVEQPTLYRAIAADSFGSDAHRALASGVIDGVILMSPMTARTFAALIDATDLLGRAEKLTCFCLSDAVAEPLKALSGARILVAQSPSENDLLALIGHEAAN